MTENKFCSNHPAAKAIESCGRCSTLLCGMCANYVDEIVLCESCVGDYEAEKFVSSQAEKIERPESTLIVDEPVPNEFFPPTRHRNNNRKIQYAVTAIAVSIISVRLFLYTNPAQVEQDPATAARQQALSSLVDCMLVFREIGLVLQSGRMPGSDLICADSAIQNVVAEEEGSMRIYHPNPQFYGYREISVSDDEPEPRIIRAQQ